MPKKKTDIKNDIPLNARNQLVDDMCAFVSFMQEAGRSEIEQVREIIKVYHERLYNATQASKRGEPVKWDAVINETRDLAHRRASSMQGLENISLGQ